jgi:hypothetical protein
MAESTTALTPRRINWSSALIAGLIATVAITITMALFGQNIMKMLGSTMLGENASVAAQYMLGGVFHLMVGLIYGVIYAWLFGPVRVWNPFIKGAVYGLAITAIALATMPVMMAMMGGDGARNPCAAAGNPCAPSAAAGAGPAGQPANPCNPCAPGGAQMNAPNSAAAAGNPCNPAGPAGNPCNPCNPCAEADAAHPHHAANPCNPCAPGKSDAKPANACSASAGNPCNPCGGAGEGPWDGMISLLNHLVFALVLAFVYRPGAAA